MQYEDLPPRSSQALSRVVDSLLASEPDDASRLRLVADLERTAHEYVRLLREARNVLVTRRYAAGDPLRHIAADADITDSLVTRIATRRGATVRQDRGRGVTEDTG